MLFDIPESKIQEQKHDKRPKLKKGQTINDLINQSRKLVEEKLSDYKSKTTTFTTPEEIENFFREAEQGTGVIGIDTETTGLNVFQDKLVGISLCNGVQAAYIPVEHISAIYRTRIPNQINPNDLRKVFKNNIFNEKFKWVYHNAKFDLPVLYNFLGFEMPAPYWDTLIVAYVLNQNEDHGLKALYNKYIAEEDEGVNRFDTLFNGITFDNVPLDLSQVYAGKDALMTYKLYEYQKSIIDKKGNEGLANIVYNIEIPLIPVLNKMYIDGVNMDMNAINELTQKYSERLAIAEKKVYEEISKHEDKIQSYRIKHYDVKLDDPIKISSPSQLKVLFYNILKYKTKSGKGTGVADLEEINTPLTQALLEYRKMSKLIDAFLVSLPKKIEQKDGKIHTVLNQYRCRNR